MKYSASSILCVVALFSSLSFSPARADLKCGDAPYVVDKNTHAVSWVGPVPENAKVSYVDSSVFDKFANGARDEIPARLPKKYLNRLQRVDLFNSQLSWTEEELILWQGRHGIKMKEKPLKVFRGYLKNEKVIFSTLVQHPIVKERESFNSCSVVLQRAIIFFENGREDLYLRSYFHSSHDDDKELAVNFVPKGGLKISFETDKIWFPLELSGLIFEPASYLVLDIVTPYKMDLTSRLPKGFKVMGERTLNLNGIEESMRRPNQIVSAQRIEAVLAAGKRWPDLNIKLSREELN